MPLDPRIRRILEEHITFIKGMEANLREYRQTQESTLRELVQTEALEIVCACCEKTNELSELYCSFSGRGANSNCDGHDYSDLYCTGCLIKLGFMNEQGHFKERDGPINVGVLRDAVEQFKTREKETSE